MGLMDWIKGKTPAPAPAPASRSPSAGSGNAQRSGSAAPSAPRAAPQAAPPVRPQPSAPAPGAVQETAQIAGGLDFATAIQAHRNWKNRLSAYVANQSDEKLDYRVICRDDQCVLGKWINGRGADDFGHLPSYGELKVSHGQFHLAAGRIVQLHDDQRSQDAEQLLRHGDYARYSIRVMGLISALYTEVTDLEQPRR